MNWRKLTLMIFVMTEGLPEERRVTNSQERGRRDVFQVLMLHHSECIISSSDPGWWQQGVMGGWQHSVQRTQGHVKWSQVSENSLGPPLLGSQCWRVNPWGIYPLVSRNQLVHFISSVCFNLPRNVNFAPGNLLMWRWQPNTLWHDVSSITRMATKIAHVSNISFPKLNAVYNF